jgi:glycogen(starch) synthase
MKIALIPSAYHPAIGGVETLTANLAATLTSRGHGVEVWTYRVNGAPDQEVRDGIRVRRFDFALPAASASAAVSVAGAAVRTARALRSACAEFAPDLLHVQCFSGNGVWALATAAAIRRPLVVTLQGETVMDDADIYRHSVQLRVALRVALRRADWVTGCSRFTLDHAEAVAGWHRPDAEVIYNAATANFDPEPLELPADPYVAAVGRVVHNKGFDLLLDAFAVIAPSRPRLRLAIGGEGPALRELSARAARLGLSERLVLPGGLRAGQVASLLARASAVVMPSRVEPFGIVALEGWRSGRPTIVTSRGGPPEFIRHGQDGLVVDPFDTDALAAALATILDDEELARRLGRSGRERFEAFTWPVITDRYEAVYLRVSRA